MSEKYYEAFERFCIITVDGNIDDTIACKYIQEQYGREIAVKIWKDYCENE